MVPAGEGLGGEYLAGGEVHDRLEVDRELALGDRSGQVGREREPADVGGVARHAVQGDPVAGAFGLVHGHVGAAQEFLDAAARGGEGDSGTGLDDQPHPVDLHRLIERRHDFPRPRYRESRGRQADEENRELVAAEAYDQVALGSCRLQPRPDLAQDLVSGYVSQGVVDLLEVIEVHEQQTHLPIGRPLREQVVARVVELATVGQPGERVVLRRVFVLSRQALGLRERGSVADRSGKRGREGAESELLPFCQRNCFTFEEQPKFSNAGSVMTYQRHGDWVARGYRRKHPITVVPDCLTVTPYDPVRHGRHGDPDLNFVR